MKKIFSVSEKSEIIEMALSDHISFKQIETQFGIKEKDVKVKANIDYKNAAWYSKDDV